MKFSFRLVLILIFVFALPNISAQGFLKTSGKKIVDTNGNEIILKGIGLGGWLLQEGYMLKTSGFANAEHEIREKIEGLIGSERTDEFYTAYHENYVREKDIRMLAEWGFNSIRIPMHYRRLMEEGMPAVFKEAGFDELNKLLDWCKKYELYLILDLHAAPGGQSDEPISDYDSSKPSLWESQTNQDMCVALWKELASRYVDEEWIAGYDVINEPKWDLGTNNIILRAFYQRLTDEIRSVDTNHIIYFEGNWFATSFDGLEPAWDDNMVYSFHKYWNTNNTGSIQYLLDIRDRQNVPLWLGETGENSNQWFTECAELMAQHGIGWAWWPHKKISNIAGPLSAEFTTGYQTLLDYWGDIWSHPVPDPDFAYNALMEQAGKLNIDSCKFQPDVIFALLEQPGNENVKPYKDLKVPGVVFASDYNMGQQGIAYKDSEYQNTGGDSKGNNGYAYRNDGVDIEVCVDQTTNGFNVGWVVPGEWIRYTIDIEESADYELSLRTASQSGTGSMIFRIEEQGVNLIASIPSSGGWQNWKTTLISDSVNLSAGKATLFIQILSGEFNLNYFEFKKKNLTGINNDSELPDGFSLSQNFPNPFNPATKISYTIPALPDNNQAMGGVKTELKVFDMLGREISTLVSENKKPGIYSTDFNANNIPAGVYIYKLSVGNIFSKSKKMVLIK